MSAARRLALFEAVLAQLAAGGYAEFSTERALQASGTSAAEFEAEFAGEEECLVAAYNHLTGRILERARDGCDKGGEWPARVRAGLIAVLTDLAAEPEMAQVIFRAFPGIRPSFYAQYVDFLSRFTPYMSEGREFAGPAGELPAEVELLAVGAAESIIYGELDAGRTVRLPRLMPEILFSVLVPFLGPDRAADEMRSAAAAS